MSRSFVQIQVNGKSQLTGIISSIILLGIVLTISPMFKPLPKSILSAIILSCLGGMFKNFKDFSRFYHNSALDGYLWLAMFFGVFLTAADVGMAIGIFLSILAMAFRAYDISVELDLSNDFHNTLEVKVSGVIIFANAERIISQIRRALRHQVCK